MPAKVYVGNLSWNTDDHALRNAFSEFGEVIDCIVMRDRDTGRSRGFGFVTFGSEQEATAAIAGLHEQELDGRRIKVNMANVRPPAGGGGAAGYGGGGGAPAYGGGGYGGYGQAPVYQGGGGYQGQQGGGGYQGGGYQGGGYQGGGPGYSGGGYGGGSYGTGGGYGGYGGGSGQYGA